MRTLFFNGNIHTMNPDQPLAQAFLEEDGFLREIGGSELCRLPHDRQLDLAGQTVLPGMGDTHLHLLHLGQKLGGIDVTGAGSMEEIAHKVREFIACRHPAAGQWLDAQGFNQDLFAHRRIPHRQQLDEITSEYPLVLTRICGHLAVCNTLALETLGITAQTPQPPLGEFEIGEDGRPNGVFKEYAIELLQQNRPAPSLEQVKHWLLLAMEHAASRGLTFVCSEDFETIPGCDYQMVMQAYHQLQNEGKMPLRVVQQCILPTMDKLNTFLRQGYRSGQGNDWYRLGPLKLLSDGSLGARTALLRQEYQDQPGEKGIGIYSAQQLTELVCTAHRAGMPVAVHAIGDGAIQRVLDAIQTAMEQPGPAPRQPHGIIHCQITDAALLDRICRMGVQVYAQPVFLEYDLHMAESRVGRQLASTSYAWRTLLERGAKIAGGSDCPVEPLDPLLGIYCAASRMDFSGQPEGGWNPAQRLTTQQAVELFTTRAAQAAGLADCGSLRPGACADFAVLSEDPFTTPVSQLNKIRIRQTWCGGQRRY